MADKFHCEECAGTASAKGERCSTCDGKGTLKVVDSKKAKRKANK